MSEKCKDCGVDLEEGFSCCCLRGSPAQIKWDKSSAGGDHIVTISTNHLQSRITQLETLLGKAEEALEFYAYATIGVNVVTKEMCELHSSIPGVIADPIKCPELSTNKELGTKAKETLALIREGRSW